MRRITKLLASVAMLLVLSLATSCETLVNYLDTPQTPEIPTEEYVTVSLGFDFVDLEVGYEPLSRAQENNDLYGIQVYSTPAPATECPEWKPFAYGAFYSTDNISINLLKGYEYKFVATMVKDGKEKIYHFEQWENDVYLGEEYWAPISSVVLDNFKYGLDDHEWELERGLSCLNLFINGQMQSFDRPNLERYYGELEGYTPGDKGGKAKIQLKRTSFGAKYIAKGKNAGSGTLEILMDGAMQINLNLAESNKVSDIYAFYYVREAWLDNNYSETFPVVLRLVREDGTTVPLGTHNLTFKRNATTVVNVNMDDASEASGVGVEILESGEMPEGDEVTIEDGEIVDTEVDTNK